MDWWMLWLFAATIGLGGYLHWMNHVAMPADLSGDAWYIRQYAHTADPISPPYCWRPLHPWLGRWLGFMPVSHVCSALTPLLVYKIAGGGTVGLACGLAFLGNRHIFFFNIKNVVYCDALGQCLLCATVWWAGTPWAWLFALAATMTRETLVVGLAAFAAYRDPLLLIPLAAGLAAARAFGRKPNWDNRHPLVKESISATVRHWAKVKGPQFFHYAHTVQTLRGLAFAVPFVWARVGNDARLGLVPAAAFWLAALPASGQSRLVSYGWVFFVPFLAACDTEWLWLFVLLHWFWPVDFSTYDESGDCKFGFIK